MARGTYGFEVDGAGALIDSSANLDRMRRLFRDGQIINDAWGPGNQGDFDHGSWHILCHLAGGTGVLDTGSGRAWCAITHVPANDSYQATLTHRRNGAVTTIPLQSPEAAALASRSTCIGFVEGTSEGHIFARGARDADTAFNNWPRQLFDKPATSNEDGGTVWEHWCTTRDIRATSTFGSGILAAWLTLVSRLGGRFVAAVARGRREHNHPEQLVALVKAGVLTPEEATWDVQPEAIPPAAQALLYEARPVDALAAVESLGFTAGKQHYFMFKRRIGKWSKSASVKSDLGTRP